MRMKCCSMALVCLLVGAVTPGARAQDLTHDQKVAQVRRLITAQPFVSEFGFGLPGPEQYAHLTDDQLRQEIQRNSAAHTNLMSQHHQAQQALEAYRSQLLREGRATAADTNRAHAALYRGDGGAALRLLDPTGRLDELAARERAAVSAMCDSVHNSY
jgi:hypothetical protein